MRLRTLTLLIAISSGSALASVDADIKALMEAGRYAEAYSLGKNNPDLLGEPVFDFYFGISALEAGAPGEGVLALERYILTYPDNRNARLNLGRGYMILGEDQRARDEFETLLPQATPAERATIERFLDIIRARESRYLPSARAWLEGGIGHDNNINSGIAADRILEIPGILLPALPVSPNSSSTRTSDGVITYAGGAYGTLPLAPGVSMYGSASFDARQHMKSSQNDVFDQTNISASAGLSYLEGNNLFKVGPTLVHQRLDNQSYRLSYSLAGEWSHQFGRADRFSIALQAGRNEFENTQIFVVKDKSASQVPSGADQQSNNFWGTGASWIHSFAHPWQPQTMLSVSYTREDNSENRDDLSRDIFIFRAQVSASPAPRWSLSAGATWQKSDYTGRFAQGLSSVARSDDSYAADLSVAYRLTKALTLRGEAAWNKQESNLNLFEYSRTSVFGKIRYEFE